MQRSGFALIAALVLAGCFPEYAPVARYYPPPPPPPPSGPAHPSRPHHTVVAAVPKPRPEEAKAPEPEKPAPDKVRPLGQGMLTALSVGTYMDGQEKDLRTNLRGSGVTVSRVGDNLVLNIRSDRLFAGKESLSREGDAIVHTVADSVRKFDSTSLSVNGFTDAAGAPQRDLKMSQMRADLVDKALIESGVDPHRISAKGFGAGDQKVSNAKDTRNRRVEIDITPRVKT